MWLIFGLLFVIIGFTIVNTVLMSVLHRHREFGVLQALGLTPGQTGAVVLVEGLILTGVSGVVGVGLGVGVGVPPSLGFPSGFSNLTSLPSEGGGSFIHRRQRSLFLRNS